jgi:hypothetical protein
MEMPTHKIQKRRTPSAMLDTVNNLLVHNKIPSLDDLQMSGLLQYLFTTAEKAVCIQVAEVAYRHDHDHPSALEIFLACTLPMAEKAARRRAHKVFIYPSDWQVEVMYDGAVEAMISVFQANSALKEGNNAFRRYLLRALALGTVRAYFKREENVGVRPVANLATIRTPKKPLRNQVEQNIITRELLNQIISFPHLRPAVYATLQCIRALGPDEALKEHAYTASGDADKWKRERGRRPILDPDAIAQAMGTDRRTVHRNLREARIILRSVFNADGRLFLTR